MATGSSSISSSLHLSSSRKTSVIWEFFTVEEDSRFAICDECETKVPRGGATTKSYTTTNLVNHLLKKHPEIHSKYLERKAEKEPKQPMETKKRTLQRQLSLSEVQDRSKPWDINDQRAQRVHRKIGEMLAIDCQPISMVEDVGFRQVLKLLEPHYQCPSRKYFTETIIPNIYSGMKEEVVRLINSHDGESYLSFTMDAWSSSVNDTALLSLTAHWIDSQFKRVSAVMNAQCLTEAHTGEYIAAQVLSLLGKWEIALERVHLVITDNASNMAKAMRDASLAHFGCFAHSLQLAINDGLLLQKAVKDIIATCKSIVGHFHRSSVASHNLRRIQESLNIPQHKLKQDVQTRWNSTFYMLKSVQEQKMALAAYAAENSNVQQLSSHQLDIMKRVIEILSPIEEITRSISADLASVSIIIPYLRILIRALEKNTDDSGIRTMKSGLLHSLRVRFTGIEEKKQLSLATFLDPRFKDKFFSNNIIKATIKELLLEEMSTLDTGLLGNTEMEGPTRPNRVCPLKSSILLDVFLEIVADNSEDLPTSASEVDRYLSVPLIDFKSGDPFLWWSQHCPEYPVLSKLARRFLSTPATSVPSERLFSAAGDLHDEKRNRIMPELSEELLFIQNNFILVGTTYKYVK